MADVIKSSGQIESIFRCVLLMILSLDPEADENDERIHFPWGSDLMDTGNSSAPMGKKDRDVCYIYTLPQDDSYNRYRNTRYIDRGGRDLVAIDEHTDVHSVIFVNYGPNAYECARDIRDGLYNNYDVKRYLRQNNFALIPDIPAIKRVPELINGEWWNRADVTAVFNEYVRRESVMNAIEEITINASYAKNGKTTGSKKIVIKKSRRNFKIDSRKSR